MTLCLFSSAGAVIGVIALILLSLCVYVIGDQQMTLGVKLVVGALVLLTVSGFVGCSVEDRVCAENKAAP